MVVGVVVLLGLILAFLCLRRRKAATLLRDKGAGSTTSTTNAAFEYRDVAAAAPAAAVNGSVNTAYAAESHSGANGNAANDYATVAVTDGGNAVDDYATVAVTDGGNGMVDENNVYDMQPPRWRRAAGTGASEKCTRPSPKGGVCKNNAVEGTLFCNGHTCPVQGCTVGKSTKMETCPDHVHGSHVVGGGTESGEVFYDSFGATDVTGAAAAAATPAGAGDAIYAVSAKTSARLMRQ